MEVMKKYIAFRIVTAWVKNHKVVKGFFALGQKDTDYNWDFLGEFDNMETAKSISSLFAPMPIVKLLTLRMVTHSVFSRNPAPEVTRAEEEKKGMTEHDVPMIDIEELTDLDQLKTHCIYSTDFEDLAETKQTEIYHYCKMNVYYPACRANLKQIRIAVTRIYFRNLGLNY